MSLLLGMMQPTYLPWLGYFEMMDRSDVFVLLDDVQFSRRSWHQRNRVKGPNGPEWLSVPSLSIGHQYQRIDEIHIDSTQPWAAQHWKSIERWYGKAQYFGDYRAALFELYQRDWKKLEDFTVTLMMAICDMLGIRTRLQRSAELGVASSGNQRLIDICHRLGGFRIYDTAGAAVFIDQQMMRAAGIEVVFQEYAHPVYRQLHGEFVSHMGIIDLLLNEGPRSLEIIRSGVRDPKLDAG